MARGIRVGAGPGEADPSGVGQAEALGDALEHLKLLDLLDAVDDGDRPRGGGMLAGFAPPRSRRNIGYSK
jgi:hypothetical protein